MSGCLLKIREVFHDLKPSERKIACYILNNTEDAIGLSIGELAERSGTSKAAVIRLCKTLHIDGYRELVINLASDAASIKEKEEEYTDIKAGDCLETIIRNVCYNNKKSIDDTLEILEVEEVKKAVNAIHKAKRVDFYGVGDSGVIAFEAQQMFMRINKYSMAYMDPHMQTTAAASLTRCDVAVIISYSGETKDVLHVMSVAKKTGATIISITKFGKNTLNELADIKLCLSSPETSMKSGHMGARVAQFNIIDIIFSCVASMDYRKVKKYLNNSVKGKTVRKYRR